MVSTIEKIMSGYRLIAIIIRSHYEKNGIEFFTPDDFSQQLAYMNRPAGYKIAPHVHNKVQREVFLTQEVLFLKKGKIKVDFFDDQKRFLKSSILSTGDVVMFAAGGHGIEMLESTEMIEVKQGPYSGENDKTRF